MLSDKPLLPNNGICEQCIHWNVHEIEIPGGTIGQYICTAAHCHNGSKFKFRTPETELQERAKHESW